jgi:hypothetical protein
MINKFREQVLGLLEKSPVDFEMPIFDFIEYKKNIMENEYISEKFRLDYFWDSYRKNNYKKV